MSALPDLPTWAAIAVAALVLASALLATVGSLGLLRLGTFYQRMHASTLATTLGLFAMAGACVLAFSLYGGRLALTSALIAVFITLTTPITMLLLTRAALARDRAEGVAGVPRATPLPDEQIDPR